MSNLWIISIIEISVFASAIVSGVLLTFSDFVLQSLAAAKPAGGIQSMQIINRKVFKTVFMVFLLGMSALSPVLIAYAFMRLSGTWTDLLIAGAAIYLGGVFFVSLIFNVPMNQQLDRLDYNTAEAATYWRSYVPRWRFWNNVRAASAALASLCFLAALVAFLSTTPIG